MQFDRKGISFVAKLASVGMACLLAACAAPGPVPVPASIVQAKAEGTPPVLDSIGFHETLERYRMVYPEFRFHAVDGNVVAVHRELISSSKPGGQRINEVGHIYISAEQQRRGAVYVGGWNCGSDIYATKLKAFLVDANGNRSNALEYTIQCRGL